MENIPLKEKRYLLISLTILASLLSLFIVVAVVGGAQWVSHLSKVARGENVISVTGEAEVFAVPDIARVWFSVDVERDTVEEAQTESAEKINAVLAFLEDVDIEEKDIKTTSYNVYPRYEYVEREVVCIRFPCPPVGEQVLRGYRVNQSIEIKVRDTDEIGEVLSGIGGLGVTNINGPSFEIDDEEELQLSARKEAIENARKKAEELAKSLGVRLGDVVSFSDGGGGYPIGIRADFALEESVAQGKGAVAPDIPLGENVIRSFVTITYEIK